MKRVKILVCSTGSVATIKLPEICSILQSDPHFQVELKVCMTEKALHFCPEPIGGVEQLTDLQEWSSWKSRGDPVLHIELSKWADLLLIAPLDANTLGKISSGICDNMLTCVVRAWETSKPLFFCPAMNTKMWNHPVTATQISTLKSWGYHEIPCISKTLICGDTGLGAMAEPEEIVKTLFTFLKALN